MAHFITKDTLQKFDISLDQDADSLLAHINEELEKRVGAEITGSLSDSQLHTLIQLQESVSDEELHQWLHTNVPDFEQLVADEVDKLQTELVENVDRINNISD